VFRRVVDGDPVPQPASGLLAEPLPHRLAGVRTQIIPNQMDRVGPRIGVPQSPAESRQTRARSGLESPAYQNNVNATAAQVLSKAPVSVVVSAAAD
jgi:hypothetical protein